MRICIGCNKELDLSNFYVKKKQNGYESRCKECFKIKHQENKIKNGNNWKIRAKEYYLENIEVISKKAKIYLKEYYKQNKEKIDKLNLNNYYKNQKKRSDQSKKKYKENPNISETYTQITIPNNTIDGKTPQGNLGWNHIVLGHNWNQNQSYQQYCPDKNLYFYLRKRNINIWNDQNGKIYFAYME